MPVQSLSLLDIAKQSQVEYGDFDFCKKWYDGWHDVNIENWNITRNSIKVCKGLTPKRTVEVFKHEIWHQANTVNITDEQREAFNTLNSQSKDINDFSTVYSQKATDPIEEFAEIFADSYGTAKKGKSPLYQQKIDLVNSFKPTLKPRYNLFDFSNVKK